MRAIHGRLCVPFACVAFLAWAAPVSAVDDEAKQEAKERFSKGVEFFNAGEYGAALVDGTGSTWTNSYNITVGGDGNGTLTVSGSWDDTATTGSETVLGAVAAAGGELSATGSLTWIYGPEGSTGGDIEYTGECFMTSYSNSAPVGGRVSFSATFQRTGDITRTTFS